jgi:hypothetical protein
LSIFNKFTLLAVLGLNLAHVLLYLGLVLFKRLGLSNLLAQYLLVVFDVFPLGQLFEHALVSSDVLEIVELGNVVDEGSDNLLQVEVSPQLSSRAYLLPASGTLLFINSVIIFDASRAKLVQALLYIQRVNKNVAAHRAKQEVLELVHQTNIDLVTLLSDFNSLFLNLSLRH